MTLPHSASTTCTSASQRLRRPVDTLIAREPASAIFGLTGTVGLGMSLTGIVTATGADVATFTVRRPIAAVHPDFTAPARAHAEETIVPAATAALPSTPKPPPNSCTFSDRPTEEPC